MIRSPFLLALVCTSLGAGNASEAGKCASGDTSCKGPDYSGTDADILLQSRVIHELKAKPDKMEEDVMNEINAEEYDSDDGVDSEDRKENHNDEGATRALLNTRDSIQDSEEGICTSAMKKYLCKCAKKINACKRVMDGQCTSKGDCKKKVKKKCWANSLIDGGCRKECVKNIDSCGTLLELDSNVAVTEASNRSVEDEEDQGDEEDLDLGLDDEGDQKSMDETISGKRTC